MRGSKGFAYVVACNFHLTRKQMSAIREIRRVYGVSQQRIAEWIGVSQATVSRVLRARKAVSS